jgi:hypothetical protein
LAHLRARYGIKLFEFLEHFLQVVKLLSEHLAKSDHIIKECQTGLIRKAPQYKFCQAFQYCSRVIKAKEHKCDYIIYQLKNVMFSLLCHMTTCHEQFLSSRVEYNFDAEGISRVSSVFDSGNQTIAMSFSYW